jgi:hypothetical protein
MEQERVSMKSWLLVAMASFVAALTATVHSLSGCGGCNAQQENFAVRPAESCLSLDPDVCDAQDDWMTLTNGCSSPLSISDPSDAGSSGADGGVLVIAAGAKGQMFIRDFESNGHVMIPALLGGVPVVISYDVVQH